MKCSLYFNVVFLLETNIFNFYWRQPFLFLLETRKGMYLSEDKKNKEKVNVECMKGKVYPYVQKGFRR